MSRAQRYAEFGPMDSPVVQMKRRSIQSFLLELSNQFGTETGENLKVFVAHHGQLPDSGFLSYSEIGKCKTMFDFLMALVEADFMDPHDMSKLMDFLDAGGEKTLSKKVQEFQAQAEESCPSRNSGSSTIGERPRSFRCFLLELSTMFEKEAEENLRIFVAHHGPSTEPGFLAFSKIEQAKTVFGLLMALVDEGFMKPDDMSNLIDFLEAGLGRKKSLVRKVQEFQAQAVRSFSPRSSTTAAPPCGNSLADLQTPPPNETAIILCQPEDQTRDELMIPASALPPKLQSCEGFFITAKQHSNGQNSTSPASVNVPKGYTQSSRLSICLPDDHEPPPLKQRKFTCTVATDEKRRVGWLPVSQLGVVRPYSLAGFLADIPDYLQKAMQCLVIGNFAYVLPNIHSHLKKFASEHIRFVMEPLAGYSNRDGIILDFGLGMQQHLCIQALNHPAFVHSDDYESTLQLVMEAILIAPNSKENLAKLLEYPNLYIPESLRLLYRSRLPSVATDEKLREELASQCHYHAANLRGEQQQTNFAASRNQWHLAQVYDAIVYVNKHQNNPDFIAKFMQKADFHKRAMQERHNCKPRTNLEKALLGLESTRSAQSRGYAYAEMATNGPEHPVVRREHAEVARVLHEEAISEHATPLLELLHMHEGMSEGAALVANLRFDEMLRHLRPTQLDYILHSNMWTEKERKRKLHCHLTLVVNDFDRIRDQLSSRTMVVPVLQGLLEMMVKRMISLQKEVAEGCIKGFTLDNPTMSE